MRGEVGGVMDTAKILLVDDREENLLALEAVLGSLDHPLVRATSGEEALKALLTDTFAVILLDVQMPGMDGFETAAHIKRRELTKDIPIIFLTAVIQTHTFRGYSAGAIDYVEKPFDPWLLRTKVSVFVDLHRKGALLREQSALLRRGMSSRSEPWRERADLVDELSTRLADAEEQARQVAKGARADQIPSSLADAVGRLEERLARLRSAISAIQGDG